MLPLVFAGVLLGVDTLADVGVLLGVGILADADALTLMFGAVDELPVVGLLDGS